MLNKLFKLEQHKTTVTTEIVAGITTFVTMAYALAVVPIMLADTGMDKEAVFLATCLGIGVMSIVMGMVVNLPIALGPSLGLVTYFVAVAMQGIGIPWQTALGIVFIAALILLILTITQIRQILVEAVPDSLKHALTVGIGLFVTFIGLRMTNLVGIVTHIGPSLEALTTTQGVAHLSFTEWSLCLGNLAKPETLLALMGVGITSALIVLRVQGAILLGIIISTLLGIPLGLTNIHDIHFGWPEWHKLNFGALDIKSALHVSMVSIIFTFVFVELMDTFGSLISNAQKAGALDKPGSKRMLGKAMFTDAFGSCVVSCFGLTTLTEYLESIVGISAGGRTGLTAVTTGVLFLLSLVLSSLFVLIPSAATAPALILLGVYMISSVHHIEFQDLSEGIPAFFTIILMPLTHNIANGISAGIVFYVFLKVISGKWRRVHWMMYLLTGLVVCRFVYFT